MIVGLIPARSGSKGIKNKNIHPLGGHPLLAWSIAASKMANFDTYVTTDSEEYAVIAEHYGAQTIMRPPVSDKSVDMDYVKHAVSVLGLTDTDLIIILRPTTPLRSPEKLVDAVFKMRIVEWITSLRSAHELPESPDKMFLIEMGYFVPTTGSWKSHMQPRQDFEPVYHPNGYVDIVRAWHVGRGVLYGTKIVPFITEDVGEIDDSFDYVEWRLNKYGSELNEYLKRT